MEESGISISQFCKDKNLKVTTFHGWKKRYSREKFSELKDEARIKRMRHNRRACPPLSPMEKGEVNKVQIIKFPLISKKYSKILDKNGNIVSVSCVGCTKCRK